MSKFKKKAEKFYFVPKLFNGIIGGMLGVTLLVPFEIIMIRHQKKLGRVTCERFIGKSHSCIGLTLKSEGYFGLYRLMVNLCMVAPEKALLLTANDFFVYKLTTDDNKLLVSKQMAAGGLAGAFQIIVSVPVEYLKTLIEKTDRVACRANLAGIKIPQSSAFKMALQLFNTNRLIGMYKTSFPLVIRDSIFSLIYFPLYAFLYEKYSMYYEKKSLYYYLDPDIEDIRKHYYMQKHDLNASFLTATIAASTAALLSTPLNVAKEGLSSYHKHSLYSGIVDCLLKKYKRGGLYPLFRNGTCRMATIGMLFGMSQAIYSWGVAERWLHISGNNGV